MVHVLHQEERMMGSAWGTGAKVVSSERSASRSRSPLVTRDTGPVRDATYLLREMPQRNVSGPNEPKSGARNSLRGRAGITLT